MCVSKQLKKAWTCLTLGEGIVLLYVVLILKSSNHRPTLKGVGLYLAMVYMYVNNSMRQLRIPRIKLAGFQRYYRPCVYQKFKRVCFKEL